MAKVVQHLRNGRKLLFFFAWLLIAARRNNMIDQIWKSLLVEFVGTFTLVFVGAGAAALTAEQGGSILVTALAFGLILAGLVYAWGSISGMHVNPAVSFGFACAGRLDYKLMLGYWCAQVLGAIAAAGLIVYFFGSIGSADVSGSLLTEAVSTMDMWKTVLLEAILTFFFVVTILMVTKNPNAALANGIAIGTVLSAVMLVGLPLTGAALNPARSLGPEIFNGTLSKSWIYILGPLLGGLLAALVYRVVDADWSCKIFTDENGNTSKICRHALLDDQGRPVTDPATGATIYSEQIADNYKGSYKPINDMLA